MQKLTKEQAIVVSGYTGVLCCDFGDLHKEIEARLGRPVWTHEMAIEETIKEIKETFREDFMAMIDKGAQQ